MILPSKNSQVLHTPDVDQNNAAFKDAMNDPASDKNKKNSKSICNCDQVGLRYIQGLQSRHNYFIPVCTSLSLHCSDVVNCKCALC